MDLKRPGIYHSLKRANTQLQGATSFEVRVMEFGSYPMAVLHWIATPCPAPSNPSQRSLGFSSLGETWTGLINTSVGRTILDPLQLDCGSIRKVSATGGGGVATKGAQALGTTSLWN